MARLDPSPLPDDNGYKYKKSVEARGYKNLKQTPAEAATKTDEELVMVLLKEGRDILEAEDNKGKIRPEPPNPKTNPKTMEDAMSKNPYIRARIKVLNDIPEDRRNRIEELEKTGQTDTNVYKEFVKMVTLLGDKFSEKSN